MVRRSQGASGSKDMVRLQTSGEAGKLITMFYSYFSHYYNAQRDVARRFVDAETPAGLWRRPGAGLLAQRAGRAGCRPAGGTGTGGGRELGAWAARTLFFNMFLGVPIVRDLANEASNAIAGKFVGGYQLRRRRRRWKPPASSS